MVATSLSADHTFKVPVNIEFWCNGRWVKLYDSLFIVMNEASIVVAWKLCKGTSFSVIEGLLKDLKERLDDQDCHIHQIYVDNCCQWRNKLNSIFEGSFIKLDSFHGIQRFTTTIPKKGSLYSPIRKLRSQTLTDFKLVIRDPTDQSKQRTKPTPSGPVIENNIESFLKQWKSVKFEGSQLIPEAGIDEINGLLVHVRKGCLSDIPPSGGTNHNEGIHRVLNKTLKKSRIGLQFALALLGVFFYNWNEKKSTRDADKGKLRVTPPVESYFESPECSDGTGYGDYIEPTEFNTVENTETETFSTLHGHPNSDIPVLLSDEENLEHDSFDNCENASSTEENCNLSEEERSRMRNHSKATKELFRADARYKKSPPTSHKNQLPSNS